MSPFDMCRFIDELDCKYIGDTTTSVTLLPSRGPNTGSKCSASITNIHVKDYKRNGSINNGGDWVDLLKGDVNWPSSSAFARPALTDT